ncbi:hypothetical protein LTR96_006184 [Exophiala xenobiotica]|nr:hypothetical protein LTR96_006184 [Exophiala xenobiotica]KAK5336670.1 hypothetical protein LTR98_006976 [Exophiala xenobiotica]
MDRGPHSPSSLDYANLSNTGPYGHAPLSRVTSAPESSRAGEPLPPSTDRIPRKRNSPMDRAYETPRLNTSWPSPKTSQPLGSSSPRGFVGEPPDKRARLEWMPKRAEAEAQGSTRRTDYTISPPNYPLDLLPRPPRPPPPPLANPETPSQSTLGSCGNCADAESLLVDLVTSFFDLQSEIFQVLNLSSDQRSPVESVRHDLTKLGLRQSLVWAVTELRHTIRLVQEHGTSRPGLPPLSDVVSPRFAHSIRRLSGQSQSSASLSSIKDLRRIPLHLEPPRGEDYSRRTIDHTDQMPRSFEQTLPSILQGEEFKHTQPYEQTLPGLTGQSPHPSSASTVFGSALSPLQSQFSSKTLPSPPGGHYPRTASLGSVQYSPTMSQSAHNSHLQDLQHQISTKTLALQTLQREHDQLLAAFSRSQIRCAALDKKSQVSDHEINSLSEDKIRLQQQVESLEAQVQELIKARDEIVQQSTADGTQWRQIMAMSSQLQIKGAEDAKRFKAERDAWDDERAALQKRIEDLESSKTILPRAHRVSDPPTPVAHDSILSSESVEVLRQEVVRLRQRCSDLELKLQNLAGEAEQIENAISAMENLRRTLAGSKRSADET